MAVAQPAFRSLFLTSMQQVTNYRDLETWQIGMDLVERCYTITASFPAEERYGLTAQIRRAAVSVPSNVAEGCCRKSTKAFANHVSIALGSHAELETCLELALRLAFIDRRQLSVVAEQLASAGRLLNGLHRSLKAKLARRQVEKKSR